MISFIYVSYTAVIYYKCQHWFLFSGKKLFAFLNEFIEIFSYWNYFIIKFMLDSI